VVVVVLVDKFFTDLRPLPKDGKGAAIFSLLLPTGTSTIATREEALLLFTKPLCERPNKQPHLALNTTIHLRKTAIAWRRSGREKKEPGGDAKP